MSQELVQAVMVLTKQKGVSPEVVFESLEASLLQAYRKEPGSNQDAYVELNRESGEYKVFAKKTVVAEVEDAEKEISLAEAQQRDMRFEVGDIVEVDVTPKNFGRSAAHTAKQMLIQRLKEAERSIVYEEYFSREGDIITGLVQRVEGRNVFVDLGKTEAILPPAEQIPPETYKAGEEEKTSRVIVPDYQLSLAIGKAGQNARLAAKLTNWKIDIKSETQADEVEPETAANELLEGDGEA